MKKNLTPVLFAAFIFGFVCGYLAKPSTVSIDHSGHTDAISEGESERESTGSAGLGASVAMGNPGSVAVKPNESVTAEEFEAIKERWLNDQDDLDALLALLELAPIDAGKKDIMTALSVARGLAADSHPALLRLIGVSSKFGAHPLALMTAQQAINLDPKNPEPYRLAGRICMFDLQEYGEAKKYYEMYLTLDPTGPAAPMIRQALEMLKSGAIGAGAPLGAPPG